MDPPRRENLSLKDTFKSVFPILLIHFEPPRKDNLPTKDNMTFPKVSFIRRLHCNTLLINAVMPLYNHKLMKTSVHYEQKIYIIHNVKKLKMILQMQHLLSMASIARAV